MVELTQQQKEILINERLYKRYKAFIKSAIDKAPIEGENHHIIPKCIGGDNSLENIAFIGYREHYIAHYMLAKCFNDDKLWFAFNCMRRVCNGKSALYEAARKYISKAISKSNSGRKMPEDVKKQVSERNKNTIVVSDKDGNFFRVEKNDPKYISGEYVFYRTGYKHSSKTKERMKKNGIRGRKAYHDKDLNIIFKCDGDDTTGLTLGYPEEKKLEMIKRLKKPGRKLKLVICPHCGCEGRGGNMTRYHFNNCNKKDLQIKEN